jgi:hypothetical protein
MTKSLKELAIEYLNAGLSIMPIGENLQPPLNTWEPLKRIPLTNEEVEILFVNSGMIRPEIQTVKIDSQGREFISYGVNMFGNAIVLGIICGEVSGGLEVIELACKSDSQNDIWEQFWKLVEKNLPELHKELVVTQSLYYDYKVFYRCGIMDGNQILAIKKNEDILIKTYGEGSFVIFYETTGHKYIQGELTNIPTITPEQRTLLLTIARTFDEIKQEKPS